MRERRSLDKGQLPESDYEVWLHSQKVAKEGKKHRSPSEDLYEAWVKKKVLEALQRPLTPQGRGRPRKARKRDTPLAPPSGGT